MSCDRLYKILLQERSSFDERVARKTYYKILLLVHPDKCDHPDATRIASMVTYAMSILGDSVKRGLYNALGGTDGLTVHFDVKEADEVINLLGNFPGLDINSISNDSSGPSSPDDDVPCDGIDDGASTSSSDTCPGCSNFTCPSRSGSHSGSSARSRSPPRSHAGSPPRSRSRSRSPCSSYARPSTDDSGYYSSSSRRGSFRRSIMAIVDHTYRRGALRFKVIWGPGRVELWELYDDISHFRESISAYLVGLGRQSPRRLSWLLRQYPFVGDV